MRFQIEFHAEMTAPEPVAALAMIEPSATINTVLSSVLTITPETPSHVFADVYGNACRRLRMPSGDATVDYAATVEVTEPARPLDGEGEGDFDLLTLPAEAMLYLLPSRYCPTDMLGRMAADLFGLARPTYARVQDICSWIYTKVLYAYGASTMATTAYDTATQRIGVCRDFAHLGICLCRALNIPARYASGYCLGLDPPDLHAYFQAYLGGRWYTFDPTSPTPRPALATIAIGRDAADCAWWTAYGDTLTQVMVVSTYSASS